MALHLAHEGSARAGKSKGGGIVSRTDDQDLGKGLADLFVQGINRFEVNGLVDVVMQMDKQSMHQCFFDPIHSLASLKAKI
jgi:hypothetical protein